MALRSNSSSISWALWAITVISLITSIITLSFVLTQSKKDIVCVDAVKLITKYKGVEEARKSLQTRNDAWKARLDTLRGEFEGLVKEYQQKKGTTPAKELKLMEQLLKSKQQTLVNYENSFREQMQKQDEELASKILAKVNDFVKRYGKEKGYTIILAATQMGSVAYTNESYDITDEVLAGLNAEYLKRGK